MSVFQTAEPLSETAQKIGLNHHVDQWCSLTNATEFRVLWFVSKYAVKYPGTAHLKAATIAEGLEVSTKTVYRALKALANFGAIIKHVTTRPVRGGQGANIYVVPPVCAANVQPDLSSRKEATKPCESKREAVKTEKETASLLSYKSLLHNTYQRPFYRRFKEFISNTIGDNQPLISRLYGVYKAHSTPLTKYGSFERTDVEHAGYEALRASVMAMKSKRIKNLAGYYNGTLDRMLDRLVSEESERVLAKM
ncbi:HTH domain-containing protein [Bacillus sp. 37MA]|uniref:HTH domain-containing protein n=1 Tax=Bacillus sp. 37MA TaxID=1132442 RepID=UPI00036CEE60|nr:HTH domain-containing protein [Bacillus sp. 37MA]